MGQVVQPWSTAMPAKRLLEILPKKLPNYFGCVYGIEYGGLVKIGFTKSPGQRLKTLAVQSGNYGPGKLGSAVFSPPHANYIAIEKQLHQFFAERRTKAELFRIGLSDLMEAIGGLELRDDSAAKLADHEVGMAAIRAIFFSPRTQPGKEGGAK